MYVIALVYYVGNCDDGYASMPLCLWLFLPPATAVLSLSSSPRSVSTVGP